ncbi:MAG: hypothetical protein HZA80_01915 [Candidatus Taylorbacteria bacterium]|nr:hypothetical protein [Candidatus Taylorbacteria bacterium]
MQTPYPRILKQFGLNPNDIKIYRTLYNLGRSKTGIIIRETAIASSRVYASLQNLVRKGLVSYQVKNNIKYYQAELPDQLIEEAEDNVEELKGFADNLKLFPISKNKRNETNTYEGVHGLKMAYEQHTENLEKGETVSIIAFVGEEYASSQPIRLFFSKTIDRIMIEKKCHGKMITHKEIKKIIKRDRPDSSIYTIRHLSENYTLPYTVNISKKEVVMGVWGDEPTVFTISNPVVVSAFQKNFDYLWKIAK